MKRALFESDHEEYRSSVKAFLQRHVIPFFDQWCEEGLVPRELFCRAAELGVFAAGPEQFGGAGHDDFRYSFVLMEEAAFAGVSSALLGINLQADVMLPYLLALCSPEQRARWIPGAVAGDTVVALAITEPGAGSDVAAVSTRAVRDGDDYVVTGSKTFISNGLNADLAITLVRTGERSHGGLSLLVMDTHARGFSRAKRLHKLGQHPQDTVELSFNEVRVPVANRLGEEGLGFKMLMPHLARERVVVAAMSMAATKAAFAWTLDYVRARHVFGAALGSFQNTRFRMAEMATEIDVTERYVDDCVRALLSGELTSVDAAKAKWWATELQGRVIDACLQLHGGYGYMNEYPISRAYADARVTRIFGGSTEIMKEIIGRSLKLG